MTKNFPSSKNIEYKNFIFVTKAEYQKYNQNQNMLITKKNYNKFSSHTKTCSIDLPI